ncbi:MAG TPA: hypothetical protein VIE65_10630, partial [Methylobacter sp.]
MPLLATLANALFPQDVFAIPFVFPVAHELYHLRQSESVWRNPVDEERAADIFAISIAKKIVLNDHADRRTIFVRQSIFSGFRFLQDKALASIFNKFRSLNAYAFFAALYHHRCETMKDVPREMRFNNPDVVGAGMQRTLPVLSDREVLDIAALVGTFDSPYHENM